MKKKDQRSTMHMKHTQFFCSINQVIIMNPNGVMFLRSLSNNVGKTLVHCFKCSKIARVKIGSGLQIVEQRPDNFVGKSKIKQIMLFDCQFNGG